MKLLKGLLITVIVLGAIGAVGYYFVNKYIEDRAVEYVEQDLDDSNIALARDYVDNSPSLKAYISEGADANLEELPFQTREEATRAVMKKLSLQEMQAIQAKAADGMSEAEAMELADTFEEKLTDEEMLALKAIIYKELYE
ncbi:hypothetical protein LC085_11055 [Bacillus tianshenii]|uniref:hypothetical protein n=1 Tax=Sutcliffiella tianshenii TaxID=1463404 RepID=UPI001CD665C4|nr:hypothetical protein [Bacillus tianshenii]MCA1320448.1 hypothetical protein [Bacillus tianshenii]